MINICEKYPKTFCSDELYVLANKELPPAEIYDEANQYENGIGMLSKLLANWKKERKINLEHIEEIGKNIVFVTGKLAYSTIKKISDDINSASRFQTRVVQVDNNYFGNSVTVAGLLTATDIFAQVKISENEIISVCETMFKGQEITLDEVNLNDFMKHFQGETLLVSEEFGNWYHYFVSEEDESGFDLHFYC